MASDGKDARDRIASRIRALLSKTVANGCTEAEALSAASLAADLLARYEMDLDEAEVRATPVDESACVEPDAVGERLWRPAGSIARLTRCKWWTSAPGVNPVRVTFLGLSHEVEIAGYLMAICSRAMRDEVARLDRELVLLKPDFRRRRRNAFLDGMSESLRDRIAAMVRPEPAGKGIVVARDALVEAEMERRGIRIEDGRGSLGRDFEPGYDSGRAAGDRVALDPGLEGGPAARGLIGSHRREP